MHTLTLSSTNLSAYRASHCLFQALNFTVQAGEILQILGPNGAGKSTLLKLLAGLRSPDKGSIVWNGEVIAEDLNRYQAQLAYLGHRLGLKLNLTVNENLAGSYAPVAEKIRLLKDLSLETYQASLLSHLSQGQKQRVALARVCLSHKKIWILDEPFSALDQSGFELAQTLIQQHLQEGGVVILSSHRPVEFKLGVQTIYLEKLDA